MWVFVGSSGREGEGGSICVAVVDKRRGRSVNVGCSRLSRDRWAAVDSVGACGHYNGQLGRCM
jgi:hypothetical protein